MSTATVPYGTVEDTTTDSRWTPVTVVATMAEAITGLGTNPMPLDGPLSWCAAQAALAAGVSLPPVGKEWTADLVLPLATWTAPPSRPDPDPRLLAADGQRVWGWACSRAEYVPVAHTVTQIRRRPAAAEMARYTQDRKHHSGLGPYKARDTTMSATLVQEIRWHALADWDGLATLLEHLTHLGRATRHGNGRILRAEIRPGVGDWTIRPWPDPNGGPGSIRAPYHHHTRRMPCSSTRPA